MKKLILLVAVAAFATSCNYKAKGNHGVIPVVHEPATAEEMHHKTEAAHEAAKHGEVVTEEKQEEKVSETTLETPIVEKKDTLKADH